MSKNKKNPIFLISRNDLNASNVLDDTNLFNKMKTAQSEIFEQNRKDFIDENPSLLEENFAKRSDYEMLNLVDNLDSLINYFSDNDCKQCIDSKFDSSIANEFILKYSS